MSRSPVLRRLAALVSVAVAASLTTAGPLAPAASGAEPPPWTTVASGLDNPRHLTFGPKGALYVVEAGTGGSGPCIGAAEGQSCFGTSGAISRILDGRTRRVASGFPSMAAPDGSAALGPSDVRVTGQRYLLTMGLGNDPAVRRSAGMPRSARKLATLLQGRLGTREKRVVADLGTYEAQNDPDGNIPDTDPTGMVAVRNGVVLTDSGGNDLLRVSKSGRITTLAVFPDRIVPFPTPADSFPMQAVPTSVVKGPDGAFYVSQLTGFPFPVGAANIYRVVPGHEPTVYASGFTNITDLTWHDGTLYAVQISDAGLAAEEGLPTGSLVKVVGGAPETLVADLPAPYGVAVRGGSAYVTTCAVCPDGGGVVRIPVG